MDEHAKCTAIDPSTDPGGHAWHECKRVGLHTRHACIQCPHTWAVHPSELTAAQRVELLMERFRKDPTSWHYVPQPDPEYSI